MTEIDSGRVEHLENSLASVEVQIADCAHQLTQLGLARATIQQMLASELGNEPTPEVPQSGIPQRDAGER